MKQIGLTQGKFALVDDEDFEFVNQWKWYALKSGKTFYAISSNKQLMHRIILSPPVSAKIDHQNGNGLDNRKRNLRYATTSENARNRELNSNNSSGITGVSWHKKSKKFQATITVDKKNASSWSVF